MRKIKRALPLINGTHQHTNTHTILMQVSLAQHILHPALTSAQCNKHIVNSYIVKQARNSFGNLQQNS